MVISKLMQPRGLIGVFLLLFSAFFPLVSLEWIARLLVRIDMSILQGDSGTLVSTAFLYITWYLLLFVVIYLGAMLFAESTAGSRESIFFQLMFILIIFLMVGLFKYVYLIQLGWMIHIFTVGLILFLKNFIVPQKNFYITYTVILTFLLMSFLWLNTVPGLTKYGFGIDDIALSLKASDAYLTDNKLFFNISVTFSINFFLITFIFTLLNYLFRKQIFTLKQVQEKEAELKETRNQLLETKMNQEITNLVHDLKTPLVSVEGLVTLLALKADPNSKQSIYLQKIERSIEKLKDMISEILYDNVKTKVSIKELVQYVRSFIILEGENIEFSVTQEENLPEITVNKIRFARALTNVIENSIASIGNHRGEIQLAVFKENGSIVFQVKDNGPGIDQDHFSRIWKEGFSTKSSSGIGLSFVKRVVENHQGFVRVKSKPWQETIIELYIPFVEGEDTIDFSH